MLYQHPDQILSADNERPSAFLFRPPQTPYTQSFQLLDFCNLLHPPPPSSPKEDHGIAKPLDLVMKSGEKRSVLLHVFGALGDRDRECMMIVRIRKAELSMFVTEKCPEWAHWVVNKMLDKKSLGVSVIAEPFMEKNMFIWHEEDRKWYYDGAEIPAKVEPIFVLHESPEIYSVLVHPTFFSW
jgi:hypothetical protein